MLATLFQKTTPISYVYTALLMVGAVMYRYMEGTAATLALSELRWYFLDGMLAMAVFFLSNIYFRATGLLANNNYFALFYVLLYCFSPHSSQNPGPWIELIALLWMAILFIRTPWKKTPEHYLIDMSLMLGLAIFINGVNVVFLLLLYVGLISVKLKKTQYFLQPVFCLGTMAFMMLTTNKIADNHFLINFEVTHIYDLTFLKNLTIKSRAWTLLKVVGLFFCVKGLFRYRRYNRLQKMGINLVSAFFFLSLFTSTIARPEWYAEVVFLPILAISFYRLIGTKVTITKVNILVTVCCIALFLLF